MGSKAIGEGEKFFAPTSTSPDRLIAFLSIAPTPMDLLNTKIGIALQLHIFIN